MYKCKREKKEKKKEIKKLNKLLHKTDMKSLSVNFYYSRNFFPKSRSRRERISEKREKGEYTRIHVLITY